MYLRGFYFDFYLVGVAGLCFYATNVIETVVYA